MYRYLLFGFDRYYPSGGMNDCLVKFNNVEDINFKELDCDCESYTVYDTHVDFRFGFNLNNELEEYEEKHGDIPWHKDNEIRRQLIKDFLDNHIG